MSMISELYKPLDISTWTVLVTGATSGIGRATAWRFAELGCRLVVCGRRTEALQGLAEELKTKYPSLPPVLPITLDVSDLQQLHGLQAKLDEASMGEIDILVNNAGLALGVAPADENNIEDIQKMMATNVTAPMALVSIFAPGMKKRGRGHIINISSVAAHESYSGGSVYCATKHAVKAFTIAARHDLAGTPIRVTAISPGMVETEFSKVRFGGDDTKAAKVYEGIVPMVAEDIADQVAYAATRPGHVQVADIISYATNQGHAKYLVERKGPSMGAP
mmetsp:Transcript_11020/g.24256  ORF Transcript_11020/g.24256 Transcript_11020/m.24256 type:complete len:277 (-) Transcript_11020:408-1238(-)|eukprot:CAMPEP_0206444026 /NCGR_PEP_ID=MMETSP0324_2-20121206/14691_1 /ASSEMBLY_ACC=CAM_ASM_000836 /TAXON_ID=2866 /ORGANISM="Crypthecodinium cohnii, Strain Seligo" /LENGTH=276 /DNA_ID=CAMNT_0053912019 /DNA_START=60 /DNA_END=890 /DNA_ORIENTATION=-